MKPFRFASCSLPSRRTFPSSPDSFATIFYLPIFVLVYRRLLHSGFVHPYFWSLRVRDPGTPPLPCLPKPCQTDLSTDDLCFFFLFTPSAGFLSRRNWCGGRNFAEMLCPTPRCDLLLSPSSFSPVFPLPYGRNKTDFAKFMPNSPALFPTDEYSE